MADKEEIAQNNRIINTEKYKCRIKKGRIYIDVRDKKLNCLLSKVYSSQEAIEKMAKAIFTQIWGLPNNRFDLAKSSVKVRNRKLAEAALNALLEDK